MGIGIVVILYHPSSEDLQQVERLKSQYTVAVVDNTQVNRGIACAQNEGMRILKQQGVEFAVLLDQDSRVDLDFPRKMVEELKLVEQACPHLAALGPTLSYHAKEEKLFIPQREIIASGTCMRMSVWDAVGPMEEELFIDFVDFEWCWRAEAKGYVCGRTGRVHMAHRVGQHLIRFGSYCIFVSRPIRYYYQYRNHRLLSRRNYVPMQWKIATGIKHIARFLYLPWLYGGRALWNYMWRGWTMQPLNEYKK